MVGYTGEGASDAQWFANPPADVWKAVLTVLRGAKMRSRDDRTMRLEANLGMTAFTGSCIASVSVQPAQGGGANLRFSGRMGAFSGNNIAGRKRIEDERTRLINGVADLLPAVAPAAQETGSVGVASIADELAKLAQLRDSGVLTQEEFQAQKAKLLDT